MSADEARRRARIAANRRHHPDRPELVEDDLRQLREDVLARHIQELVDEFPPLTVEQRRRLAVLLHPGANDAGAA